MEEKPRIRRLQKFKPQQTAIAGGTLLMLSSGIHIGYGFFHWRNVNVAWTESASHTLMTLAVVAWFMGSIVGFTLAPSVVKFFRKKIIYVRK